MGYCTLNKTSITHFPTKSEAICLSYNFLTLKHEYQILLAINIKNLLNTFLTNSQFSSNMTIENFKLFLPLPQKTKFQTFHSHFQRNIIVGFKMSE